MISFWQQHEKKLVKLEQGELDATRNTWVDARSLNKEDMRMLEEDFGIQSEHILDILDPDELSRIEKEDEYTLIIARVPLFSPSEDVSYYTIPLGIIIFETMIVTICWKNCEVLQNISGESGKCGTLTDFPEFVLKILSRSDITFLRYLKEINRISTLIQNELQRSIQNNELIKLLNLEKSLVFFTTSLKSNQLLLEKLAKTRLLNFDADDREELEDVEIDNRQAIEMADTYSDIMSGMMDAFASVISNNLNIVMKKLTVISLILMVPTLIASFFGMNIPLPFTDTEWLTGFRWLGLACITAACLLTAFIAHFFLNRGEMGNGTQISGVKPTRERRGKKTK